jgi:alpha-galactosidase
LAGVGRQGRHPAHPPGQHAHHWHQGWNDAGEPFASEYKNNLPDLISDLRAEFGNPNLPFTIATTGMGGNKPVEEPPYTGYSKVEQAQLWVAGVTQPSAVLSTDTRPYWRDAAISPSTLGFHWNHNGESYFLVGKSLGDKMQPLLGE